MISDPDRVRAVQKFAVRVADEMALTVFRTTYSGVLKDNMDYSTAIFDGSGYLAAQGLTLPGHLGSMPTAMAAVKAAFAGRHRSRRFVHPERPVPGRHASAGCLRVQADLLRWRAARLGRAVCHHTDVGGRVPGSNASDSTEIYQEGLRIPPLKLYDRGERNETLFALIETQCAGAGQGVRRSARPARRLPYRRAGADRAGARITAPTKLAHYMTELVDYAERMTRAAIRDLPDGVYDFLDHIDDDGIDVGRPIPLKVTITKSGDHILVDWTGTSPQVKGAINNTLSYTKSASYCAHPLDPAAEHPEQ